MATTEAADRPALSPDTIARAGIELADAEGLDAVSMRRLADALGYGAMSLYNHVPDKGAVLEGMLDLCLAGVPTVDGAADWRAAIREIAAWLRGVLRAHPWACDLWPMTWPGPHRAALMEGVLASFREGGFDRRMAHHGFHALDLFVVGHVHQEAAFTIGLDDPEATAQRFLEQNPASTHPYVHEHVEHHADEDVDEDDFAFLLELLLDGLALHLGVD